MPTGSAAQHIQQIFERAVRDAVRAGEQGLQIAVYQHGKLVADAHAGIADAATGRPVDSTTLFNVFSVTKGFVNVALQIQIARGLVDTHAPVARYWPEFAAGGKSEITVEAALSHRAGLPQMPDGVTPETMADYDWMVRQLAGMTPMYPGGSTNAYHAYTWGWLIAELVTRTDPRNRPIRQFIEEEICRPLKIGDFYLGLPDAERSRRAILEGDSPYVFEEPGSPLRRAVPESVATKPRIWNEPVMQGGIFPGAGAISNAQSIARLWAMLAAGGELDGVRILPEDQVRRFHEPRPNTDELDLVLGKPVSVSRSGFWLAGTNKAVGTSPRLICQPGHGGSLGWADPDHGLAVAVCHNRLGLAYGDALAAAMHEAFGEL